MRTNRWKPCWWCGKSHLQLTPRMDEDPEYLAVTCTACGACGPDGKGERNAVRLWNKGPTRPAETDSA